MMKTRFLALLLIALLWPAPAHAQEAPHEARAKMHNKLGLEYVDQGELLKAIEEFKKAYQAHPRSKYLSNTARAYELIGRLRDALYYYERAAAETNNINRKARISATLEIVRKRLAVLTVKPTPEDALVEVDGSPDLCAAGKPCYLDPGEHRIRVSAPGYTTETRKVKLDQDDSWIEKLVLARSGTVLTVESNIEGSAVFLDGKLVGRTPLTTEDVEPGQHKLRVEAKGAVAEEKSFEARTGELASFTFTLTSVAEITRSAVVWRSVVFPGFGQLYAGRKSSGAWFVAGEALCIIGTGVGLGLRSYYLQQRQGTSGTTYGDWTNLARTSEWVAIGAGSAGLLLWGINVIHASAMTLPGDQKKVSWSLLPVITPGNASALLTVSF
jgi:tetratricopeptide (TPR) repeat protein